MTTLMNFREEELEELQSPLLASRAALERSQIAGLHDRHAVHAAENTSLIHACALAACAWLGCAHTSGLLRCVAGFASWAAESCWSPHSRDRAVVPLDGTSRCLHPCRLFSSASGELRALRLADSLEDTVWAACMVNSRCFSDTVGACCKAAAGLAAAIWRL